MITQVTLVIIGVVLVATMFSHFSWRRRVRELEREVVRLEKEKEDEERIASGFEEFNRQMGEIKQAFKKKVFCENTCGKTASLQMILSLRK